MRFSGGDLFDHKALSGGRFIRADGIWRSTSLIIGAPALTSNHERRPDAPNRIGDLSQPHRRFMMNSAVNGIEEARARENLSRQIFKNFRDATVALLDCDDTPNGVDEAVVAMLDRFNNEFNGANEDVTDNARRVMSNVFGLNDSNDSPAPAPVVHKEIRAEEFTLVDASGNTRARLWSARGGGVVLTMYDSQGRPRLRFRASDNEAMITICGERGEWGKGVLPATDEVERLEIGYEPAEQDARIVIKDGNERECVSLSVFAEGDGFVCLRQPLDGSHTVVDSEGLIAFDGKYEPLPEYRDHQAEASTNEPTTVVSTPTEGDVDHILSGRSVSDEEAEALADELLVGRDPDEADEVAAAVFKIADKLAYERCAVTRESSFIAIARAIYSHTRDRDEAMMRFAKAAGAKFGEEAD